MIERLTPALDEVETALDVVNGFRGGPAGTLRLNVPVSAARLVLPAILPGFLAVHPDIRLQIIAEDSFVDVLAAGCDAGIRYDERLEQDMIAVPIGPRIQRMAVAAAPAYLDRHGRPSHPRDLLDHACLLGRFASGALTSPWEFERAGEIVRVEPRGPLVVQVGGATRALLGALVLCAAGVQAQVVTSVPAPAVAPIMAGAADINVMRIGTKIPLKLSEELTTKGKKLRVGQHFNMEVAEPVLMNGQTVIPAGAPAVGEITEVRNEGMWGKSGHLTAQMLYVTVNGRQMRITGTFEIARAAARRCRSFCI